MVISVPSNDARRAVEPREEASPGEICGLPLETSLEQVVQRTARDLLGTVPPEPSTRALQRLACNLYDARRARDRHFDQFILGEPGWDILLALYALPSRGELLGISSLAHCAGVPPTTGLRWEGLLREKGLIERGPHVSDKRVQLVRLTDRGRELMEGYLTRLYWISMRAGPGECPVAGA